jgi:hypothetical protein
VGGGDGLVAGRGVADSDAEWRQTHEHRLAVDIDAPGAQDRLGRRTGVQLEPGRPWSVRRRSRRSLRP